MRKKLKILFFVLLFLILAYLINFLTYTHIQAKFEHLRPIKHSIPVYYKGLVIGRAHKATHSKDYKHTIIKIVLYPRNLLLPENTEAFLKKEKKKHFERDFIELVYPKNPSNIMIANGSIIDGRASVDVDEFFSNQHPDDIALIKENLLKSSENLNITLENFSMMFDLINEILSENKSLIKKTTSNIESATKRIDNSINDKALYNSFSSIESTSKNFSELDLKPTIENGEEITSNLSSITCGIRKTLRKKFGMFRLFFGQVINECD